MKESNKYPYCIRHFFYVSTDIVELDRDSNTVLKPQILWIGDSRLREDICNNLK